MAAAWPTMDPSYPLQETPIKSQIKSTFENGKVQSRVKFTSLRYKWRVTWQFLPEAQYQSLVEYFDENQGETFSWTHPITTTVYTVRFSDDSLPSQATITGHRTISLNLEQA